MSEQALSEVRLTDGERLALYEATEKTFLDTTVWGTESEREYEAAIEAIIVARLAPIEALADSDLWRESPCDCSHRADLHKSDGYGPSVCIGGLGLCGCDWTWPRIVEARLRAALTAVRAGLPVVDGVDGGGR